MLLLKREESMEIIQTTLRLPVELHRRLKDIAESRGVSLNEFICYQLDKISNTASGQTQSPC